MAGSGPRCLAQLGGKAGTGIPTKPGVVDPATSNAYWSCEMVQPQRHLTSSYACIPSMDTSAPKVSPMAIYARLAQKPWAKELATAPGREHVVFRELARAMVSAEDHMAWRRIILGLCAQCMAANVQ